MGAEDSCEVLKNMEPMLICQVNRQTPLFIACLRAPKFVFWFYELTSYIFQMYIVCDKCIDS